MPASHYRATDFLDLAGRVIDNLGLPRPVVQTHDGDALDIDLRIDGVQVNLCYEPEIHPGHFLVDAHIGPIGPEPGAKQRLLAENAALLELGWLTMGCHPGTDELSYFALLEIAAAQADGVADCVRALVHRAHLRGRGRPRRSSGMASPTISDEAPLRLAVVLSDDDRSEAFDEQVRGLCEDLQLVPDEESQTDTGGRSVLLTLGDEPVLLTHRTPVDAFFVARGAEEILSAEAEENVASRLLRNNAEFAHDGTIAFALTPDFRHVIWRLTSPLRGAGAEEIVSLMRWAADTAACTDTDQRPPLSLVHMLA